MKSFCLSVWILVSCQNSLGSEDGPAPVGLYQSPINLQDKGYNCELNNLKPLLMFNYDSARNYPGNLTNTGHTAQVNLDIDVSDRPGISGGPLNEPYTFQQYHFHWGKHNRGSEHTVNEYQYAMEIHLVHFKTEYGSFAEAMKYDDGLAVLAFFVEGEAKWPSHYFEIFTQHLQEVRETMSWTKVDPKGFYEFRDIEIDCGYYTYHGSLTTPPYTENVQWIIIMEPIHCTTKELARFRTLMDGDEPILENWRPIQPQNNRGICYI